MLVVWWRRCMRCVEDPLRGTHAYGTRCIFGSMLWGNGLHHFMSRLVHLDKLNLEKLNWSRYARLKVTLARSYRSCTAARVCSVVSEKFKPQFLWRSFIRS